MLPRLNGIRALPKLLSYHYQTLRFSPASPVSGLLQQSNRDGMGSVNGSYIEAMHQAWQKEPNSVHLSWQVYFNNLERGCIPAYQPPPNLSGTSIPTQNISRSVNSSVATLNRQYYEIGHYHANLDPLNLKTPSPFPGNQVGIFDASGDATISLSPEILPGYYKSGIKTMSAKIIASTLNKIYCGKIGFDFSHIRDDQQKSWLRERIEIPDFLKCTQSEKKLALSQLMDADSFERTFASKLATVKRYGIEGADAMMPALNNLIDQSAKLGVKDITIGMPHRGRLNVYTNLMGQPPEAVFAEFSGKANPPHPLSGDSAYHLSVDYEHRTPSGQSINLSLSANPSHLEAVNPVTLGTTYAKQKASDVKSNLSILLHGDAAMAGQGVVYETMGFHSLPKYSNHGTIHMVVNNQIGFTTNPNFSRSTHYCCDIAKIVNAPVFHVNGDDIESVLAVSKLACEWRQTFQTDVFIDLVCYRRHGHNEVDQPSYTQPRMYQTIKNHPTLLQIYSQQLVDQGVMKESEVRKLQSASLRRMESAYTKSSKYALTASKWTSTKPGLSSLKQVFTELIPSQPTAPKIEDLQKVASVISQLPKGFTVHDNLTKVLQARYKMAKELESVDWATAEQLAIGTLLAEGYHVRISGQDVERGTFSQRHAVIVDQLTQERFTPLHQISPNFEACNSHLSEFAVLGFEYGYSIQNPNALVIWEAQFGDFSNVAQTMIDQFIASGEQKWLQPSGLTLLLPHGFDGNGPEHSSGRMERYLQLVDDEPSHALTNWSIVSCSTPSNYFHVLRRQLHRSFRKPLIAFNSKALLRHPAARSSESDFVGRFQPGYPEQFPEEIDEPSKITTHILCTGSIYYRLLKARQLNKLRHVAISRIEELTPFPKDVMQSYVEQYPNSELVWCQEEPKNMGAYSYLLPKLQSLNSNLRYCGRISGSYVATGHKSRHIKEEYEIISEALYGEPQPMRQLVNGTPLFS